MTLSRGKMVDRKNEEEEKDGQEKESLQSSCLIKNILSADIRWKRIEVEAGTEGFGQAQGNLPQRRDPTQK